MGQCGWTIWRYSWLIYSHLFLLYDFAVCVTVNAVCFRLVLSVRLSFYTKQRKCMSSDLNEVLRAIVSL